MRTIIDCATGTTEQVAWTPEELQWREEQQSVPPPSIEELAAALDILAGTIRAAVHDD